MASGGKGEHYAELDEQDEERRRGGGGAVEEGGSQALSLKWSFGFNKNASGGVFSLSDDARSAIFYFSAHMGVVYDLRTRRQTLLQGHCNPISCAAVSEDKRWIATADAGPDSVVVVWDSFTGAPIKTLFGPHAGGAVSIDMSGDAMFLATLSAPQQPVGSPRAAGGGLQQEVAVWEWTSEREGPLYRARCPQVSVAVEARKAAARAAAKAKEAEASAKHKGKKQQQQQHDEGVEEEEAEPSGATFVSVLEHVRFSSDPQSLVTTGAHHVTFWSWAGRKLESQTPPPLRRADFGSRVGCFTHTSFLPGGARAVSGTTEGNLVLWDTRAPGDESKTEEASRRQQDHQAGAAGAAGAVAPQHKPLPLRAAIKVVKLNRSGGIPFLTSRGGLIAVCGEDETVRLYDSEFRIVAWYEDLEAGSVTSVSFSGASTPAHFVEMPANEAGTELAAHKKAGPTRHGLADFVVSTSRALVLGVDAAVFDDPDPERRHGTLLLQGFDAAITALVTHPLAPVLVAASAAGVVQAWDYEQRRLLMVRTLSAEDSPTCAAFSPDGGLVAVGTQSGMLRLLRWAGRKDLAEVACFQPRPGVAYQLVEFAKNGTLLAVADTDCAVGLYRFVAADVDPSAEHAFQGWDTVRVNQGKRRSDPGPGLEPGDGSDTRNGWTYLGRHKAHSKPVTGLCFGVVAEPGGGNSSARSKHQPSAGRARLFSVAEDGVQVEYDLENSSVVDGVQLVGTPRCIEFGGCYSTCCLFQPASARGEREDLLLTANTDLKLRGLNANNRTWRRTTLGPTYGGALTRLVPLASSSGGVGSGNSNSSSDSKTNNAAGNAGYLAYATADKVIGLIKTPLEGNPFKAMGLIAHPQKVSGLCPSFDGKYLLSAGGDDLTVNVWAVNTQALDVAAAAAQAAPVHGTPKGLAPFLPLLDGGAGGALFDEMVDYFYYAQLRCQGEDTTSPRRTDGLVPLTEVPNLMRALGFYPSEHQIQDMCSEVRYSEFAQTARTVDAVSLEQWVKLYVNHRPVVGVSQTKVRKAFETISKALATGGQQEEDEQATLEWKTLRRLLESSGETMSAKELESCLTMLVGRKAVNALRPSAPVTADSFCEEMLGLTVAAPPAAAIKDKHK